MINNRYSYKTIKLFHWAAESFVHWFGVLVPVLATRLVQLKKKRYLCSGSIGSETHECLSAVTQWYPVSFRAFPVEVKVNIYSCACDGIWCQWTDQSDLVQRAKGILHWKFLDIISLADFLFDSDNVDEPYYDTIKITDTQIKRQTLGISWMFQSSTTVHGE